MFKYGIKIVNLIQYRKICQIDDWISFLFLPVTGIQNGEKTIQTKNPFNWPNVQSRWKSNLIVTFIDAIWFCFGQWNIHTKQKLEKAKKRSRARERARSHLTDIGLTPNSLHWHLFTIFFFTHRLFLRHFCRFDLD